MTEEDLLACPLCGGRAVIDAFPSWYQTGYFIRCDWCELALTGPGVNRPHWDKTALIAAWNRREQVKND